MMLRFVEIVTRMRSETRTVLTSNNIKMSLRNIFQGHELNLRDSG